MDVFSFFSFNKRTDWKKGWWTSNLKITNTGISLKGTKQTGGGENLEEGLEGTLQGVYFSTSIDSTRNGTRWHKYRLYSHIPQGALISVSYYSSDTREFMPKESLEGEAEYMDLDELIMDNTIEEEVKVKALKPIYSDRSKGTAGESHVNAEDALFLNAKGRYLWLKIEFIGVSRSSPKLEKIRVYFPRMSYLSYLPSVYQEDEKSRDFLERFLSLFSTFFADMEENINNISQYFDADYVPEAFLKWLAMWLAIATDESWSRKQLSMLVKKAPRIYKRRGTRRAIEEMVEIYTGEKPYIVEYFQLKDIEINPEIGRLLPEPYDMDPYTFYVFVKSEVVNTLQKRLALQKILDEEKPAFTRAKLVVLQPWMQLGMFAYMNVNTHLPRFTGLYLGGEYSILDYTVLSDKYDDDTEE